MLRKAEKIWPIAEDFLKESENLEAKALFEHLIENHKDLIEEHQYLLSLTLKELSIFILSGQGPARKS